jgi:hypothetical protein
MKHPYRMVLTYLDGTTSSLWVGGNQPFADFQEGFFGVSSDLQIVSATLHAPDRSVGVNYSATGGDWTYQFTKPKKGDFYTYNLTETYTSDQSSALLIGNFSTDVPEPTTFMTLGGGLLLVAACLKRRHRSRKSQ